VVMRFRPSGEIVVTEPSDPWLTGPQAAEFAGMLPSSWRGLVNRGGAPPADDPGDLSAHPRRRNPRWRRSTVAQYRASTRYRGKQGGGQQGDDAES
jgi:hypothetical protein